MKRAVLVASMAQSSGPWAELLRALHKKYPARDTLWIGVDRGAWTSEKLGIVPHLGIGDWDSVPSQIQRQLVERRTAKYGMKKITLPTNKDRSDLWFALGIALELGVSEIICTGVTGGRSDHQLAMIQDLSQLCSGTESKKLKRLEVRSPEADYFFLNSKMKSLELKLKPGQLFSVFSLSSEVRGLTLKGLKYPLKNYTFKPGSHGLSNVVVDKKVSLAIRSGVLLGILEKYDV